MAAATPRGRRRGGAPSGRSAIERSTLSQTGRYNARMLPGSYAVPAAVILIVGGALSCLLGHRVFRIVLGIFGLVLGGLIATSVLAPTETTMTLVVALAGGALGAVVLMFAYVVGVAFAGAALAAVAVHLAFDHLGREPHALIVVAACVAGALAAMAVQRIAIVVGTAFGGAWFLILGTLTLMGHRGAAGAATTGDPWMAYPLNPAPGVRWVPFAWLALGLVGTAVQLRWTMGRAKAGPPARKAKKAQKAA